MRVASLIIAIPFLLPSAAVDAAIITTEDGAGSDVAMRRNDAVESNVFLRIKNASRSGVEDNNTDRIGVLNFDLSLEPNAVSEAAVVVTTDLDGDNQFLAGETLYLYGIPDLGADENYTGTTLSGFEYSTGVNGTTDPRPVADLTANSVNDVTAVLLDTITFSTATVAGDPIKFYSPALSAFVAADTNDVASFILTVSESEIANTAVIASAENTNQAPPTLLTNGDVPEPSALVLLPLVGFCLTRRVRADR